MAELEEPDHICFCPTCNGLLDLGEYMLVVERLDRYELANLKIAIRAEERARKKHRFTFGPK